MHYDIIGDIHGHLRPLEQLLAKLGYSKMDGTWQRPGHQLLFCGDFIDRGPDQLGVLETVRSIIEAGCGSAVMGNHEFNAIGWATNGSDGRPLRSHSAKNQHQHQAFLQAVQNRSDLHQEWVGWFHTLPLWLDLGPLRLVHACWHQQAMAMISPYLGDKNCLPSSSLDRFYTPADLLGKAAEVILKGPEVALPAGVVFKDKDGHERRETRIRWWDQSALTYRSAALIDDETLNDLPDISLPAGSMPILEKGSPIFFGHYWLTGSPRLTSSQAVCLDFSIAKDGVLAAYSFNGEPVLELQRLSWAGHEI